MYDQDQNGSMPSRASETQQRDSHRGSSVRLPPNQSVTLDQGSSQRPFSNKFAGGWQSNADMPERRKMVVSINDVLSEMDPEKSCVISAMALEKPLYKSAKTKEEYINQSTLRERIQLILEENHGVPPRTNVFNFDSDLSLWNKVSDTPQVWKLFPDDLQGNDGLRLRVTHGNGGMPRYHRPVVSRNGVMSVGVSLPNDLPQGILEGLGPIVAPSGQITRPEEQNGIMSQEHIPSHDKKALFFGRWLYMLLFSLFILVLVGVIAHWQGFTAQNSHGIRKVASYIIDQTFPLKP